VKERSVAAAGRTRVEVGETTEAQVQYQYPYETQGTRGIM